MILDIPKIFEGHKVTIVGGGYSLIDFDWNRVRGKMIAVNYAWRKYPKADICIGLDSMFYERPENKEFFEKYEGYMICDREPLYHRAVRAEYEGVAMTDDKNKDLDWHLQSANTSGYFALAVAFMLGASKVYLLGFDGGFNGQSNWYYHNENITSEGTYEYVNRFYSYFKDYPVINVGLTSKIPFFKKVDLNEDFYKY